MDDTIRKLIFQLIDQTISPDDFDRLQDAIESDHLVRDEYLRAVQLYESLGEISQSSQQPDSGASPFAQAEELAGNASVQRTGTTGDVGWDLKSPKLMALAASILLMAVSAAFLVGRRNNPNNGATTPVAQTDESNMTESLIAGHATLRRSVDLKWSKDSTSYREGDVLPDGMLQFDEGVAEIDLFCGATLIIEGPAKLNIESDWSVEVLEGRLRANVPPAARGFVVRAAESEIIDLGTEFALEVASDNVSVKVIDGEVKLQGGEHDGQHLLTGDSQTLHGGGSQSASFDQLSTGNDLGRRRADAETERFETWKQTSAELSNDPRLIAYYPISHSAPGRIIKNAAESGRERDGLIVGPVSRSKGRFGADSDGLEFDRPGSRVRMRIDGEFDALTFAAWVRIDSLEHRFNAIFMGDGYENGEPHWQIRDDGRLMFSVMIDDSQDVRHFSEMDQRVVKGAGLHRVYYTDSIWDIAKSGQWFHIAAVYDPAKRSVRQYVNGEEVGNEEILDTFRTGTLRIGPAEIGNWGQPFRETPWFAVRNLNGMIDDLAIFDAALSATEVNELFQQGKPLGY